MPRGDKSSYTNKQRRQAEHIEESYKDRGASPEEAERRAWATVNKETGGGKRKKAAKKSSAKSPKSAAKKTSGRKKATGRKKASRKKSS
jgi:plasmid stabilization system protein ParE